MAEPRNASLDAHAFGGRRSLEAVATDVVMSLAKAGGVARSIGRARDPRFLVAEIPGHYST
jgi:hypothetical protein